MDRIGRFEDIWAWQAARDLNRAVYAATRQAMFAKDYSLTGQIQRAAVSVMSNMAEGFERGGRTESKQFVSIAKGSCAKVRSLLYAAKDVGYLDDLAFDALMKRAEETGRLVGGLRKSLEIKRTGINEEQDVYRNESQDSAIGEFRESGIRSDALRDL